MELKKEGNYHIYWLTSALSDKELWPQTISQTKKADTEYFSADDLSAEKLSAPAVQLSAFPASRWHPFCQKRNAEM